MDEAQRGNEEQGPDVIPRATKLARRSLVLIAIVAVVFFLEHSRSVTVPLAFAVFLIALYWPLYAVLERRIPASIAAVLTLLAFLVSVGVLILGLVHSGSVIADHAPEYSEEMRALVRDAESWLGARGIDVPQGGEEALAAIQTTVASIGKSVYHLAAGLLLVTAYLLLGLLEVRRFREKIAETVSEEKEQTWILTTAAIARDFQRYVVVRTLIGLITGAGIFIGAWAIDLELAFVWGLSSFLLNYIPTLGSVVAVFPPVVFSLMTKGDLGHAFLTFGVMGGYQLLIGNYVDPILQGRFLKLSPLVVVLSVVFWGWIWGIPGAFIAMPATTVIVLICMHTERARWAAKLLVP